AIFPPTLPSQEQMMGKNLLITETGYEVLPFPAIDRLYAQQLTISVAALLFRLEAESEGQVKVVRTVDELVSCLQAGILAVVLHFEGAEAIDPGLDALDLFSCV